MKPVASSTMPADEHAQLVERRELRLAAVDQDGDRQGHRHQQAADHQAEGNQVLLPLLFAIPADVTDRQQGEPTATLKISSLSQTDRWLSTWIARNISAASTMAMTRYHRRQAAWRTSQAASRLSTASPGAARPATSGRVSEAGCQAAEGQQGGGHERERHQRVGALEGRLGQARPLPEGQAISDQQDQAGQGEGERVVLGPDLPVEQQLPDRRRRPRPCRDRC